MTTAEALARLCDEQGFLVVATPETFKLGSIRDVCDCLSPERWPLRCIGESNHAEYAAEIKRLNEVQGTEYLYDDEPELRYYRMEPTD